MTELLTKSLAQIVNEDHRAAAIFEKYHLDFCCKGKRSLLQACTEKELQVQDVVSDLAKNIQGNSANRLVNYQNLSLSQLADHIVATHHDYVKTEMPSIYMYLQKIAAKHGERHPEMLKVFELFAAVKEEMDLHMQKEENVLFPRIKEMEALHAAGDINKLSMLYLKSPINVMEQEHDHAGTALAEMRALTNNYTPPGDACTTYRLSFAALEAFELDLHHHIHLENNILFPKAIALFGHQNILSAN